MTAKDFVKLCRSSLRCKFAVIAFLFSAALIFDLFVFLSLTAAVSPSRPDMKILFMSAYPEVPGKSPSREGAAHRLLQKPIAPEMLAAIVCAELSGEKEHRP